MIERVSLGRIAQSQGVVNQNDKRTINDVNTPIETTTQVHSAALDQVQIDNADSSLDALVQVQIDNVDSSDTSSHNQISKPNSSSGSESLDQLYGMSSLRSWEGWARCYHCKLELQAASKSGTTSLKKAFRSRRYKQ